MMSYKRLQVAQHFGRDTETIRRWSIEFAAYLSLESNSTGRNKSLYSDADMERLSLIHAMYEKGSSTEDIHIALKSGQKGEFDGFLRNSRVILSEGQAIQLRQLVSRNEELEDELAEARQTIASLQAKAEAVPELQSKIDALNRHIGRLELQIEMLTKKE